jgi:hypothetical protein
MSQIAIAAKAEKTERKYLSVKRQTRFYKSQSLPLNYSLSCPCGAHLRRSHTSEAMNHALTLLLIWRSLLLSNVNVTVNAFQPFSSIVRNLNSQPLPVGLSTLEPSADDAAVLGWSFLDGVYLITCPNADPGGARLQKTQTILQEIGLSDKLVVKEFVTDDENRIRGCYNSHISVMKEILGKSTAKNPLLELFGSFPFSDSSSKKATRSTTSAADQKEKVVLILEDNLALNGNKMNRAIVDAVATYCTVKPTWDMIHLAYIPYVPDLVVSGTSSKSIVKLSCGVGSALGTTAYIINSSAMKTILQEDQDLGFYAPIPDVMAKLFPESRYAADPTIFTRAPDIKSLVNPQLDDLRSLLFQPAVAGFSQRLLAVTGLSTNVLLPLIVALLLLASAASGKLTLDFAWTLATTGDFNGPILLPILSSIFTLFSLLVIAQGAILAPKPPDANGTVGNNASRE